MVVLIVSVAFYAFVSIVYTQLLSLSLFPMDTTSYMNGKCVATDQLGVFLNYHFLKGSFKK